MNYFDTYFSAYGINITRDERVVDEPTADNLRAAAKVLEEKAKELDKPKLTDGQHNWLDNPGYSGNEAAAVLSEDGLSYKRIYSESDILDKSYTKGRLLNASTDIRVDGRRLPCFIFQTEGYPRPEVYIDFDRL